MGNAYINNALHATNCITRFKTWAAENPDKYCDCELGKIKARIAELEAERDAALAVVWQLRDALAWLMKASINLVKSKPVRLFEETVSECERALAAAARVLGEKQK